MQKFKKMTGRKYIAPKVSLPSRRDLIASALYDGRKRVEPIPRMCAGRFQYVAHRFPIKGGISTSQANAAQLSQQNYLLKMLEARDKS